MLYFPNAKINIGLNVLSKRKDGYHNIESVFYPIPLHDVLEIIPANKFQIDVTGVDNIKGINFCEKAYYLLKEKYDFSPVKCHLHKIIPIGAGLGGGSADVAFFIKGINDLFDLEISNEKQKEFALSIGSDCPFFIDNKPKYVTGRGDVMESITFNLKGCYLVIINPKIHISTKEAYENLIIKESNTSLRFLFENNEVINWRELIKNDFEENIMSKYPIISSIKEKLYGLGAKYASMTGTGSTVFGLFEDKINLDSFSDKFFKFQHKL